MEIRKHDLLVTDKVLFNQRLIFQNRQNHYGFKKERYFTFLELSPGATQSNFAVTGSSFSSLKKCPQQQWQNTIPYEHFHSKMRDIHLKKKEKKDFKFMTIQCC